ncbi:hypothetical protein DPMN_003032 [Dreissena polymorpha]|uniref:Uncharacterized protein n=1 Tax=Dreissena polymorpha TaxID=45954 RepID=A0A9D4MP75_DREPO|nr:hypothetical protein DPMN_003032 [Dreissena polymorpha]
MIIKPHTPRFGDLESLGSCSVSNSILMTKPRQRSSNNSSQVEDHPKPLGA